MIESDLFKSPDLANKRNNYLDHQQRSNNKLVDQRLRIGGQMGQFGQENAS